MKKHESKDLYEEAVDILQQSVTLEDTAVWQLQQVDEVCNKYSDAELDAMDEEEREAHFMKVEELYGRLKQSEQELKELDERYQALREKVNKKYGKEIIPIASGRIPGIISPEDEVDLR